jgi:hypothetical protein
MNLDDFITLSEFLLGVPFPPPLPPIQNLDPNLANVYMTQLSTWSPQGASMNGLLTLWESIQKLSTVAAQTAAVNAQIMNDPNFGPLARQIILAWYTGFHPWSMGQQPTPDPANYEQTLVWLLAQAHPMGVPLSFGYWQYLPPSAGS